MILKPLAKPVRIRIKSGGMEHSSVESLKSHFVVDDIKDLVADGRLSRWLEQQNHRSIPNEILALNKDSMEFELAVYRFFFDENKAKSNGELYYSLYRETNNEAFLLKSAEELFPKALIELDERRKAEKEARRKAEKEARRKAEKEARRRAEEEARRRAEEEARKKKEEYLMIGEGRYVELYKDCGVKSINDENIFGLVSSSARILTCKEWNYLLEHINPHHPLYEKCVKECYIICFSPYDKYHSVGRISDIDNSRSPTFFGGNFPNSFNTTRKYVTYSQYHSGLLLLFKDVEI